MQTNAAALNSQVNSKRETALPLQISFVPTCAIRAPVFLLF